MPQTKLTSYKITICLLLPIFLGYSNYLFNIGLDYNYDYYTVELFRNNLQLIIFTGIIFLLLGKDFYTKHNLNLFNTRVNILLVSLVLCYVLGNIMLISGSEIIAYIAIACLFGPIVEGFCTQSILTVIDDKNKKFTLLIVALCSLSFSLMHLPYNDMAPDAFFLEHLQKYTQHFIYALYLSIAALYFKRIDISILLHSLQNASYFIWM